MKLTLKHKILFLVLSLILLLSISSLTLSYYSSTKIGKNDKYKELASISTLSLSLLDEKYPGDFKIEEDKLYKGSTLLNDNFEFVDLIKEKTNSEATIFLKDKRITTSILNGDKRAVGTTLSKDISTKVLNEGNEFIGEAEILSKPYMTKYLPLKDSNNNILGILFVGVETKEFKETLVGTMVTMIGISLGVIVLSIVLSIVLLNKIIKPLITSVGYLKTLSTGDLTIDIDKNLLNRKDEIGELSKAIDYMKNSIKTIVLNVKNTSEEALKGSNSLHFVSSEMSKSSQNISASMEEMAGGATTQAEELMNITEDISTLSNIINDITFSIEDIHKSSIDTNNMSNSSNKDMIKISESIGLVRDKFSLFTERILSLGNKINDIHKITSTITNISKQTNLLALNATISAAKAGEHGRSFSIIADEIRKLSEQSKASSDKIAFFINDISKDTINIVEESKVVGEELSNQLLTIDTTLNSFKNITNSFNSMMPKISKINHSIININEKKEGIFSKVETTASISEEISASTEEMASTSVELSSSSLDVSKASESLKEITEHLRNDIEVFKV